MKIVNLHLLFVNLLSILIVFYFPNILLAQGAINYSMTKSWGESSDDIAYGITTDPNGNVFIVGEFGGSVDFNPGAPVDIHIANGTYDYFLTKYNSDGTYAWTVTSGGADRDAATAVATDQNGNVFVSGAGFLTKYNGADGSHIWTKNWSNHGGLILYGLAVDSSGNVYVSGPFSGTVDFNGNIGVDNHTSNGNFDSFLTKYSNDGAYIWTKTWGSGDFDEARAIALDVNNNIFVSGRFAGTADFDPGPNSTIHASNGQRDSYVSKFSSDGNHSWTQAWGGAEEDYTSAIATDSEGNAYITGYYSSGGSQSGFLKKYSSNGTITWTKVWGGLARGLAISNTGEVYVTGYFMGTVDFDPESSSDNFTGNNSGFLSKYSSTGNYGWTKVWGGEAPSWSIKGDPNGNLYIAGYFFSTVDFNPGPGADNKTSFSFSYDIYMMKLDRTFTISGSVVDSNGGVSGVNIDGGSLGSQTTDNDGQFAFQNIASGTNYSLTASKAGYDISPASISSTLISDVTENFYAELDLCPSDPDKLSPGVCGCGFSDLDSDSDGTPNCNDSCPNNNTKLSAGVCGCAVADTDTDGDGTPDCNDQCINDRNKSAPGLCGCGITDLDTDSDGIADCSDSCPLDSSKISQGVCGCGMEDDDSDGDGKADCIDSCPNDSFKETPGICGCGIADLDSDQNGKIDCLEPKKNSKPNKPIVTPGKGRATVTMDKHPDSSYKLQYRYRQDPWQFIDTSKYKVKLNKLRKGLHVACYKIHNNKAYTKLSDCARFIVR